MKIIPAIFEQHEIRRAYDEKTETWWFSVIDIIQVLTQQADYQTARNYWKVLRHRLAKEGSQTVTNCNRLKLPSKDGKMRLTDVANAETLLRLVQSVPSPKAEPIKLWLAKVGFERMQEMADPALGLERARATWQKHGRSSKWIERRPFASATPWGKPRGCPNVATLGTTRGLHSPRLRGWPGDALISLGKPRSKLRGMFQYSTADDRAGDPKQTHRLLGRPRHQEGG